jgi:hypothetical protein
MEGSAHCEAKKGAALVYEEPNMEEHQPLQELWPPQVRERERERKKTLDDGDTS